MQYKLELLGYDSNGTDFQFSNKTDVALEILFLWVQFKKKLKTAWNFEKTVLTVYNFKKLFRCKNYAVLENIHPWSIGNTILLDLPVSFML